MLLPIAFTAALAIVALALTTMLTIASVPALLTGRPTGLGDLLRQLWRLPAHVVPGFVRALRRADRPHLWAAAAGTVAGILAFASRNGLAG